MDNGTVRLILQDDVLTAVLSGEIDHHTAQGMREEIDFTVNQSKPKKLIFPVFSMVFVKFREAGCSR